MAKRPNIVLITTDQHRADCLGINGHPVLSTPNLDYLGASTANFTRAYSECPSCIPARRTILTGQAPHTHGLTTFQYNVPLDERYTLPAVLRSHGYQTVLVGKMHTQPERKRYGFDHLILSSEHREWLELIGVPGRAYSPGVDGNGWVGRPTHLPEHCTHEAWVATEALNVWRRRDPTAPLFLWISFYGPHPPLTPPAHHFERYYRRDDLPPPVIGDWAPRADAPVAGLPPVGPGVDKPGTRVHPESLPRRAGTPAAPGSLWDAESMRRCRAGYYGLIEHIDDQIGRLMPILTHPDTLTLMTSDHGEMLGDHNRFRKTLPYEASARVPFLLRAPEWMELSACQTIACPVGLQDVMPTLLDAAGIECPPGVDGRSVLPLLRGAASGVPWREYLHGEHAGFYSPADGHHYLTDGRRKYIWFTQTGEEQFFDLENDPMEVRNLAQAPERQEEIAAWRMRLVRTLQGRPEGYSDGRSLFPGRPELPVRNARGEWVAADRVKAGR